MAVSELPGNPNAVWTVKTHSQGMFFCEGIHVSRTNLTNDWKCVNIILLQLL